MFDKLLQTVAPHYCYMCQKVGTDLCESCIYNIKIESISECIGCRAVCREGVCRDCRLPYKKAWVAAEHSGEIAKLIHDFKWARMYSCYKSLACLLDAILPILPKHTVVTYIPTIPPHVRRRGYDHVQLVAREFARQRRLEFQPLLKRCNNTVQHTANKTQRVLQAENAFYCDTRLDNTVPLLLIDDIVTTGATITAATRVLNGADASEVWVAAIARQPLSRQ